MQDGRTLHNPERYTSKEAVHLKGREIGDVARELRSESVYSRGEHPDQTG